MDLSLWKRLKKEQRLTFDALAEKSNIPKRTLEDIFGGKPLTHAVPPSQPSNARWVWIK